eukprot:Gb_30824 [translate_table: standard]
MSDFQTITLLPTICGVINGTHIKLAEKPKKDATLEQYMNRYHFYNVLLQGICNSKCYDVCVNALGRIHDARHWNCTTIRNKIQMRLASPTI